MRIPSTVNSVKWAADGRSVRYHYLLKLWPILTHAVCYRVIGVAVVIYVWF